MYESPINIIISELCTKLESDCIKSVQHYGFDIDKEELANALNYDRNQYEKGHTDGYNKAIDDFSILMKEALNHDWATTKISEQIIYRRLFYKCNEITEQLKEGGKNE